jgi:hypothetical protein
MSVISTPSISAEKPINNVWPEPKQNTDDFRERYQDEVESKEFHVDYLKNTFRDFARPNLYKVEFSFGDVIPSDGSFLSPAKQNSIGFLAKATNLPNLEISKQEIKRMGQRIVLPASQVFQDLQMTMLCDDNYTARKFMHAWQKRMVYDVSANIYKKVTTMAKATVTVLQLDNQFKVVFGARFGYVWPNSIGEVQFAHDSDAQVVEFPTTFCYSTYTILSPEKDNF